MAKKLKILLMFDAATPVLPGQDLSEVMKGPDFKAESDVYEALLRLGHEVRGLGLVDDVGAMIEELRNNRPDIVFNQLEQFNGDSAQEKNVIGLLEMFGIPYTGTGPVGLAICKDKALAKELLTHHRIKTAAFRVYPKGARWADRRN
jgi:D-alanine-D-alanine ligase